MTRTEDGAYLCDGCEAPLDEAGSVLDALRAEYPELAEDAFVCVCEDCAALMTRDRLH